MIPISTQLANAFGCLALIAYVLTLIPGYCRILAPDVLKISALAWYFKKPNMRRNLGLLSFSLALVHAIPIAIHRRWEFADPKTYTAYFHGILLLAIFTALAATSNRAAQKRLKKNWKKLHELTYSALFLLTWHVIGAMWGKWDAVTLVMIAIMITMCGLFLLRKRMESNAAKPLQSYKSPVAELGKSL